MRITNLLDKLKVTQNEIDLTIILEELFISADVLNYRENVARLLIQFFKQDYSHSFHNAIAKYLSDIHADESVTYLMEYIKDPINENYRGSVIYALLKLECKEYFIDFIEILVNGDYECRHMAYFIIEKYADEIDFLTKENAVKKLVNTYEILKTKKSNKDDVDRLDGIEIVLDMLE